MSPREDSAPDTVSEQTISTTLANVLRGEGSDNLSHVIDESITATELGMFRYYRIQNLLGKGGMGAVFLATDTRLHRRVALKLLLPQFARQPDAKERFLREARASAQISHDNVVAVHEADEFEGHPYISLQYLQGSSLDELLKTSSITVGQVVRIGREISAGLAAAHSLGIIHRDIKPGNLWIEAPTGRVKILDFGLAKPVDADVELTKSGAIVGTPAYMSPEQARGEKLDARSDLFSLGAVLYRLLTGKLPFDGPSVIAVLTALGTSDPAPVRELNSDVPRPLADLIHRLLSKRISDRPDSAQSVAMELAGFRLDQPGEAIFASPSVQAGSRAPEFNGDLETTRAYTPNSRRSSSGKYLLRTIAGAIVFLLALGTFAAVFFSNSGTAPISPQTSTGTEPTSPPTQTQPTTLTRPTTPPNELTPTDLAAAKFVLNVGGQVYVNGEPAVIEKFIDLPPAPFRLTAVHLLHNKQATDDNLAVFEGCKHLTTLRLIGSPVNDAGLAHFSNCTQMSSLVLHGTGIGDDTLSMLHNFKGLQDLGISQTNVTPQGVAELKKALPNCDVKE